MPDAQPPAEDALAGYMHDLNTRLGWPNRGQSPEELEAHLAYEAQLAEVRGQIDSMLGVHPHFGDDCGSYLASALRLAATLAEARSLDTLELVRAFEALAADEATEGDTEPTEDEEIESVLDADYDFDGVAPEVTALVAKLRAARAG
jgi:hypothetical protein